MAITSKHSDSSSPIKQSVWEKRRRLRTTFSAYLWLSPLILCMLVILVYPLVNGLLLSFTNADQTNIAAQIGAMTYPATYQFIGLQNYVSIVHSWFTPGSD